jgi:uncharacterized peroxidase-related enzyme
MKINDKQLKPVTLESAEGIVHEILSRTQIGLGMIPNMYAGMANNAALLAAYSYSYHLFREKSGFSPQEQEVVFLSVAVENECEYCVAAHSFIADKMSNLPKEITNAIRNNTEISDSKLRALSRFTRSVTSSRGRPAKEDIDLFYEAGYSQNDVLGVIAGVGIKTFSNYFNHIYNTQLDKPFAERSWNKEQIIL